MKTFAISMVNGELYSFQGEDSWFTTFLDRPVEWLNIQTPVSGSTNETRQVLVQVSNIATIGELLPDEIPNQNEDEGSAQAEPQGDQAPVSPEGE